MTAKAMPVFYSEQVAQARRFYREAPKRSGTLAVTGGGCEHCQADYEIHRRDFPYCSIEFVAGGEGSLRLNRESYALSPGAVFTYGPGTPHDIVTDSKHRLVKYFVDFTGAGALSLLQANDLAPGRVAQTTSPKAGMPK